MNRPTILGLVLTAACMATACDAGEEPGADPALGGGMDASAELAPVNRSGVTGTVRARHSGDEATVTLTVQGLEPGVAYPAHIHTGRCAADGPVLASLGDLTAETGGSATLTTDVEGTRMSADEPAFVQVHAPDGTAVACADLDGHTSDTPLTDRRPAAESAGVGTDTAPPADTVGGSAEGGA